MIAYTNYILGCVFNLVVAWLIVRFIYYPVKQNKNYVFTFVAFNTTIYFVLSLLSRADLSIGVGFGLFAIFSVLRYRTDPMPTREMTYLFVIIALPVMNSILMNEGSWAEVLPLLLEDLRQRTGLVVKRCEICRIDFLRDTAELRIYYDEPQDGLAEFEPAMSVFSPHGETHTTPLVKKE